MNKLAEYARSQVGKRFRPGVPAQCANFVSSCIQSIGATLPPVPQIADDGLGSGPELASRYASDLVGSRIPKSQLQPGDIVTFADTYDGWWTGRGRATVTHVGIYVGDGLMVDRPTAERPVQLRSVDTFTFFQARRLPALAPPKPDPGEPEPGLLRTLKGYFHPDGGGGVSSTIDLPDGRRVTGRVWGKRRVGRDGPWVPMTDEEILLRFKVDD